MTDQRTAWGWGLASVDAAGNTLDVWYPELKLGEAPEEVARRTTISTTSPMRERTRAAYAAFRCSPYRSLTSQSKMPPTPTCVCTC